MVIFKTLSVLFEQGVRLKNALYDKAHLKSESLAIPVISVGNLSVGGTGKTSFVIWLLRELSQRGLKAGVISRGYGGKVKTCESVPVDGDPNYFGDEPCLIANENLGPVYVGPKRVEVGRELLKHHSVDLIIADDAFQHRRLKRDIDIVLIDFSEPLQHYQLLPYGRLREGFESLNRAHVIVSTKKGLANKKDFSDLDSNIPKGKIRLQMDYKLESIGGLEPHLLVSGVAKPQGVENLAKSQASIIEHLVFGDHHHYTLKDVKQILKKADELRVKYILTTEKDAVKLSNFSELASRLHVMKLSYAVEGQLNEFFEMVIRKDR